MSGVFLENVHTLHPEFYGTIICTFKVKIYQTRHSQLGMFMSNIINMLHVALYNVSFLHFYAAYVFNMYVWNSPFKGTYKLNLLQAVYAKRMIF